MVLACGATPAALPVSGGESALQLRSLTDARRLRQAANDAGAAVVIGAGFIGCEAATSLARHGVAVTLVAPQAVPQQKRLGGVAGERLRRLVTDAGVRYVGEVSVEEIHDRPLPACDRAPNSPKRPAWTYRIRASSSVPTCRRRLLISTPPVM